MRTTRTSAQGTPPRAGLGWLAAAILAAALGCAEEASAPGGGPREVPVSVTQVETRTLQVTVRGIGTLEAREVVEVRPEISARVSEITFEEGESVEAGEVLFRLDDRKLRKQQEAFEARLKAAEVRLDNARRRFERFDPLAETRAVSGDERDQVQTAMEEARAEVLEFTAELEQVREELEDATIRAPFDGVLSEHHVDVGDFVAVAEHLATLYAVDPLEVAFTVSERFLGRLQQGQPVSLTVDAYPEEAFEGRVHYVSPALSEATRDFLVKARVSNANGKLKPGAFASAVVTVETHENKPVVPERALVATRTGYIVYVVEDGAAKRREVRIGVREPGIVEVLEGVSAGERVVSKGHMNLSDGVPVAIEGSAGAASEEGVAS